MTKRGMRSAAAVGFTVLLLSGCSVVGDLLPGGDGPASPAASTPPPAPTRSATDESTAVRPPSGSPSPTVARSTAPIPEVTPDGFREPPSGSGMGRYLDQQIDWQDCGQGVECAEVAVPLDYDRPDDIAITLAVKRAPGGNGADRSLFINPGGPGGSGWSMVDGFIGTFTGQFDVVGWDPRGVGRSTPVRCENGTALDEYYALDATPDDEAERTALVEGTREFTMSCLERSGPLLQHVSTVETVQDLDLLRRLLDNEKLHYLGYSYGTEIGATYAELYGEHIGTMVLDSAVNITDDTSIVQAQGFDRSLRHFAEWCAEGNCDFGDTADEVVERITDLWDRLDAEPLTVGDRELTQSLAVLGVLTPLYQDERVWPQLRQALSEAFNGNGSMLLGYADSYNQRDASGHYGQMLFGFNAVRCLDEGDGGLTGARREAADVAEKAPVFGSYTGPDVVCALWPVAAREPVGTITGPDAPPILVVGTTGDSATPYEYAQWMADQLESGVLLTFDGEGHGAFGGPNQCVNSTVMQYLTSGEPPEDGKVCRSG